MLVHTGAYGVNGKTDKVNRIYCVDGCFRSILLQYIKTKLLSIRKVCLILHYVTKYKYVCL